MSDERDKSIEVADPFARQLMARYLKRREDDLELLGRALAESDFEVIERTGHNLSGSGSAYGLDAVSELGRGIEEAARREDAAETRSLLDDLANYVRTVTLR